jgi:hypothetical protein
MPFPGHFFHKKLKIIHTTHDAAAARTAAPSPSRKPNRLQKQSRQSKEKSSSNFAASQRRSGAYRKDSHQDSSTSGSMNKEASDAPLMHNILSEQNPAAQLTTAIKPEKRLAKQQTAGSILTNREPTSTTVKKRRKSISSLLEQLSKSITDTTKLTRKLSEKKSRSKYSQRKSDSTIATTNLRKNTNAKKKLASTPPSPVSLLRSEYQVQHEPRRNERMYTEAFKGDVMLESYMRLQDSEDEQEQASSLSRSDRLCKGLSYESLAYSGLGAAAERLAERDSYQTSRWNTPCRNSTPGIPPTLWYETTSTPTSSIGNPYNQPSPPPIPRKLQTAWWEANKSTAQINRIPRPKLTLIDIPGVQSLTTTPTQSSSHRNSWPLPITGPPIEDFASKGFPSMSPVPPARKLRRIRIVEDDVHYQTFPHPMGAANSSITTQISEDQIPNALKLDAVSCKNTLEKPHFALPSQRRGSLYLLDEPPFHPSNSRNSNDACECCDSEVCINKPAPLFSGSRACICRRGSSCCTLHRPSRPERSETQIPSLQSPRAQTERRAGHIEPKIRPLSEPLTFSPSARATQVSKARALDQEHSRRSLLTCLYTIPESTSLQFTEQSPAPFRRVSRCQNGTTYSGEKGSNPEISPTPMNKFGAPISHWPTVLPPSRNIRPSSAPVFPITRHKSGTPSRLASLSSQCATCKKSIPTFAFPADAPAKSCTHPPVTCMECLARWMGSEIEKMDGNYEGVKCPVCRETLGFEDVKNWAARQDLRAYLTRSCFFEGEMDDEVEIPSRWRRMWSHET